MHRACVTHGDCLRRERALERFHLACEAVARLPDADPD